MIKFRYKRKEPEAGAPVAKTTAKTTKTKPTTTATKSKIEAKKSQPEAQPKNGTLPRTLEKERGPAPTSLQKVASNSSLQKIAASNSSLQKIGSTNSLQRSRASTPVMMQNGIQKTATRVSIRKTPDEDKIDDKLSNGEGRMSNTLPRVKNDQKPPLPSMTTTTTTLSSSQEASEYAAIVRMCEELFSQLQYSRERALPADEVRRALAAPFCGQRRFRLGCMADAAECFENILLRLHAHAALPARPDDACRAPHCLPHRKFAMALVERAVCAACGATSEPLPFTQMVHYISASALTTQARQQVVPGSLPPNVIKSLENFGDLLKRAGGMGDIRDCPSSCGAKTQICRSLMNNPEIVSVGVVWDSERPTLEHIMDVFGTIGTTLQLKDLFHSVADTQWASATTHNLVGVVTYYGKHYSTFFFHTKLRLWIYFDDATVKEVGPRWDQVVEKCRKGRYQPLLLLYSTPNGTPCNTENAPKTIIPYPNLTPTGLATQNVLRRSVTPSPEKPNIGNTRRAITPNPDNHIFTQNKPPIHRVYNEYQNLNIIQDNLYGKQNLDGVDMVDGCRENKEPDYISRKTVENVLNAQNAKKQQMQLHRSLSTGSTSANSGDGIVIPDHLNVPRRRDSGNWSGDRNSTSSSSSTTMENPYLYLMGKMQQRNGSLPSSPTRKGELSSGSSGRYDAGYDSYSLSSTDSLPLQQGLKHNLQLAQIPEYQPHINKAFGKPLMTQDDCGRLCLEADQLLDKSRQTEDANDLETALVLCNAAATKARAAMDAPYNNPHMMTFARMKHNTCIMRARSLHRRILQEHSFSEKDNSLDIRHSREGSNSSARHSRQNSRDKSNHSRQNSKEILATTIPTIEKIVPNNNKNIEIYATLPKKKASLKKSPQPSNTIEDEEYMIYDRPSRESRSIFGRSKNKDEEKSKEKRSRSEDRSKISSKDLSVAPDGLANAKDTLKKDKNKDDKEDKNKDKDGKPGKKQHKIRRKLLMGGLIRRKNRSMPDLTEGNVDDGNKPAIKPLSSVDDSALGLKGMDKNLSGMSGYLSEGQLEFSGGSNTNPNLERSKLMRKSFHGSAGKMLTIAKVPPPPPLRTTSQLTGNKQDENPEHLDGRPQYPLPSEYQNGNYYHHSNYNHHHHQDMKSNMDNMDNDEPQSLPFLPSYNENMVNPYNQSSSMMGRPKELNQCFNQSTIYESCNNVVLNNTYQTVVTKADVHQERTPIKQEPQQNPIDSGVDEVDCIGVRMSGLELPPYPSPPNSAIHSRQPSEEFPPPPPPLDTNNHNDKISEEQNSEENVNVPPPTGLLAQLQQKRQQILSNQEGIGKKIIEEPPSSTRSTGETWLKELQAKQAALRLKKIGPVDGQMTQSKSAVDALSRLNVLNSNIIHPRQNQVDNSNGVRNLASKFEYAKAAIANAEVPQSPKQNDRTLLGAQNINFENPNTYISDAYPSTRRSSESSIDRQQIEEEMREVELLNAAVSRQLNQNMKLSCSTDTLNSIESKVDNILRTKKKSVSFCDQVILVATAEDREDQEYTPNPILERVLKSNLNKQDGDNNKPTLKRQDSIESQKSTVSMVSQSSSILSEKVVNQPEYVKIQSVYHQAVSAAVPNGNESMKTPEVMQTKSYQQQQQVPMPNPNIYQSTSQTNNNSYQRPANKSSLYPNQCYPNQQYQAYQGQQYSQTPTQNQVSSQSQSSPITNPQYNSYQTIQNNQYQMQQKPIQQTSQQQPSPTNSYHQQQKQNSMYFPVNRTQPAYQTNNHQQQYSNSQYQQHQNSQYQHLADVNSQYHHQTDSNFYNNPVNGYNQYNSVYQRVPQLHDNNNTQQQQQQIPPNSQYSTNPQYTASNPQYISNANASSIYQRIPHPANNSDSNLLSSSPYQKVPPPTTMDLNKTYPYNNYNGQSDSSSRQVAAQYAYQNGFGSPDGSTISGNSPYQPVPNMMISKQQQQQQPPQKKSVSFEPGTKGGADSPVPKSIGVPIPNGMPNGTTNGVATNHYNHQNNNFGNNHLSNANNNNVVNGVNSLTGKSLCNLCRKKIVNSPSIYCVDCDFYMSRFKPRT